MKMDEKTKNIVAMSPRLVCLSTANREGKPNVAVFGSLSLVDDETLMVALGDNRTFRNLSENPYASCLIVNPDTRGLTMEGCRLYLKVKKIEDEGETLEKVRNAIREKYGDVAASVVKYVVYFEVEEIRPIVDPSG